MRMISEQEYFKLQEYYDYQRKVEYNRELTMAKIKQLWNEHEWEEIFEVVWSKVSTENYIDPPSNYVPENESLRFENENIEKWRSIPWRFIPKDEDDRSEYKI
jgi:hypothetical protein